MMRIRKNSLCQTKISAFPLLAKTAGTGVLALTLFGVPFAARAGGDPLSVERAVTAPACRETAQNAPLRLGDAINLALCRNPETRRLYMGVMAAAAEYGQAKADYWPTVDLSAGAAHSGRHVHGGGGSDADTATARLSAQWLLYDFGGREAATQSARQALAAALATRSDTLQGMIFDVAEAYYLVFAAQAEQKNSRATLDAAQSAYDAAAKRYDLGLAALSDRLQAETSRSEAQLTVAKADRALAVAKGNLAVLMNYSPDYDPELASEGLPAGFSDMPDDIDALFKTALNRRADIAAQKAAVEQARSDVAVQESKNAPSLSLSAGLGADKEWTRDKTRARSNNIGLSLTVPLFTGFKNTYRINQARYRLEQSEAALKKLESDVKNEVWTTYQNFFTAKKTYEISQTMLASAGQNAQVALGAYKAGRGSILNVLDAQSKLADARTTNSRSLYELLIARTDIVRKIGLIDPFKAGKGF